MQLQTVRNSPCSRDGISAIQAGIYHAFPDRSQEDHDELDDDFDSDVDTPGGVGDQNNLSPAVPGDALGAPDPFLNFPGQTGPDPTLSPGNNPLFQGPADFHYGGVNQGFGNNFPQETLPYWAPTQLPPPSNEVPVFDLGFGAPPTDPPNFGFQIPQQTPPPPQFGNGFGAPIDNIIVPRFGNELPGGLAPPIHTVPPPPTEAPNFGGPVLLPDMAPPNIDPFYPGPPPGGPPPPGAEPQCDTTTSRQLNDLIPGQPYLIQVMAVNARSKRASAYQGVIVVPGSHTSPASVASFSIVSLILSLIVANLLVLF